MQLGGHTQGSRHRSEMVSYQGIVVLLAGLIAVTTCIFIDQPCCFPDHFSGKIKDLTGSSRQPFLFSVDFRKQIICGEIENGAMAFCAKIEPAGYRRNRQMIYAMETTSQQCYVIPHPGSRVNGRCTLKETAFYAGNTRLDGHSEIRFILKHPHLAKLLGVEPQGLGDPAFMTVNSGNCVPIMTSDSNSHEQALFFDVVEALTPRHEQLVRSMSLCQNLVPNLKPGTEIEIYKYLFDLFFPLPKQPNQPCCGPLMWQGTLTESIQYQSSQGSTPMSASLFFPQIYVNYVNGQIAGSVVEYVEGQQTMTNSFLLVSGETMMFYAVNPQGQCSVFNVTDVTWSIVGANCIQADAVYRSTVSIGFASKSVKLNVWENQGNFETGNYTNQRFVSEEKCSTVADIFHAQDGSVSMSGNAMFSNVQPSIVDDVTIFRVPKECRNAPIQFVSMSELPAYVQSLVTINN